MANNIQFPEADPILAQGLQEAHKTQMQAALHQLVGQPGGQSGPAAYQTAGGVAQTNLSAIGNEVKKQDQQQTVQRAQTALTNLATVGKEHIADLEAGLAAGDMERSNTLSKISTQLKAKLLDEQLKFKTDAAGRQLLTTRQLSDWAVLNSRNENDFQNKMLTMEEAGKRQIQIMQQAHDIIQQAISKNEIRGRQITDEHLQQQLHEAQNNASMAIAKMKAKQANNMAMFVAGGSIVGAVAGAALGAGTPQGAAGGAMIGSSLGGATGSIAGASQ